MTVLAVVVAVVALVATTALASLGNVAPDASPLLVLLARIGGYIVLTLVAAAIAATLYRYRAVAGGCPWVWITPGSLFAAVTWLLLTAAVQLLRHQRHRL